MNAVTMVLLLFIMGWQRSFAANAAAKMTDLHKKISTELMTVRKTYPETQQTIFAVLDRVGKLYGISKSVHDKRVAYKKNYLQAQQTNTSLKKEVEQLRGRLVQAKNHIDSLSKQLGTKKQELAILAKQKELLAEKTSILEAQQQRHDSQVVHEIAKEVLKG